MKMTTKGTPGLSKPITAALALAVVTFALAFATRRDMIDGDVFDRILGLLTALVLVVCGNFVPKEVCGPNHGPNHDLSCDPSKEQSRRRFAGYFFVSIGVVTAIAWLFLSIETAQTVATVLYASGAGVAAWLLWPWVQRKFA